MVHHDAFCVCVMSAEAVSYAGRWARGACWCVRSKPGVLWGAQGNTAGKRVLESRHRGCGSVASPVGEGNGTPLQYSRLENPMDGGAW